jgi:putative hemolysin
VDDVGWSVVWLIVFSGATLFFSLNSLALRMFSRIKLQDAFKNTGKEDLADKLFENAEKLALTCSFFRIVFNISILFILLRLVVGLIGIFDLRSGTITFILGVLFYLVFSVAIPAAWAKYTGEKILVHTYGLLLIFSTLTYPVQFILKIHDIIVRRLAGVTEANHQDVQEEKQEEFLNVVEQGKMEGIVDAEEQEMIENVLELDETDVDKIMTPRTDIVAINADADFETVLKIINDVGHSRIPVYEDNIDKIIGLVYAKDLLSEFGKDSKDFRLRDKLREAYFVPETKSLRELLHEFQNQKLHIAVVLDEYGGTAGIITIEDIIEEVMGEITDEYEEKPPQSILRIDDSTIEVDARVHIDDINEEMDIELPEDEDYDTIGGFVFSHLGNIPVRDETFEYRKLKFTITDVESRKINRLRIQKLTDNNTV